MVDKNYWSSDLPHPLSPNVIDVALYENYMVGGSSLLLGSTKGLIPLSDRQLDSDPWYESTTVIVGDWRDNKHYYSNILLDGGLCFTKELCDEILEMASKNCKRFISEINNVTIAFNPEIIPTFHDLHSTKGEIIVMKALMSIAGITRQLNLCWVISLDCI